MMMMMMMMMMIIIIIIIIIIDCMIIFIVYRIVYFYGELFSPRCGVHPSIPLLGIKAAKG